jgi:predicted lipoprotein
MKVKHIIAIVLVGFMLGINACKPTKDNPLDKYDRGALLNSLYNNVISPVHVSFKNDCNTFDSLASVFNQNPTEPNLIVLQQQWITVQRSWQLCEPLNLGPIADNFAHNSINKWVTNTQFIEDFIAGADVLDEAFIESIGSTSKGLPAIEYLIFDNSGNNTAVVQSLTTGTNAARRLSYVRACVANLDTKAAALLNQWQAYQNSFVSSTGIAIDGSTNEMVNAVIEHEEFIKNTKVGLPLGKKDGIIQTDKVESPYSNTSMQHIRQNLLLLQYLFDGNMQGTTGTGLYNYLDAVDPMVDDVMLSAKIKDQLQLCINAANAINTPLEEAIVNENAKVETLYLELKKLTVLLKVDMTGIIGATVTFTDNDGD